MMLEYVKTRPAIVRLFLLGGVFVIISNLAGVYFNSITDKNVLINILFFIFSFFPILLIGTGFLLSALIIATGFKKFDLLNHNRLKVKYKNDFPNIDVFLPICGEDKDIIQNTWGGVNNLSYPKEKINVYVLDDKGDKEIEILANKFGFNYLSRPNKGEMKKAGNLKFGFENSKGEYIVIFDADFRPQSNLIENLIIYHLENPNLGIVQSPQAFKINKKENPNLQQADAIIQQFFYKIVEVARNTYHASICVGTNAIYNRKALIKAGGFYQIEHSEDSHTGFNLYKNGYKTLYIPLILSYGYCPSDFLSIFKQRTRWCQGSLILASSKLFWDIKLPIMARISFLCGFIYYLGSFIVLLMPLHILYSLWFYDSSPNIIYFLPNIIYLLFALPLFYFRGVNFHVFGHVFFTNWSYSYIIFKRFILKKNEGWVATGSKQGKNKSFNTLIKIILTYIFIYWVAIIGYIIFRLPDETFDLSTFTIYFWLLFNVLSQSSFLFNYMLQKKQN